MQAKESQLMPLLEGSKKYLVPLYQRQYSWGEKEWKALWDDIINISESKSSHFFGTIVTYQETTAPHQLPTYVIIDGQQRLTTIFIIMICIHNLAIEKGDEPLAAQIQNQILTNPYNQVEDRWKLSPAESNKRDFFALITQPTKANSGINLAFSFFLKKFAHSKLDMQQIFSLIKSQFVVVDIVLSNDDNPHMIFESLNAKGQPLTQADLIRNFILMKIPTSQQKDAYELFWLPIEKLLNENITEFIRHYLIFMQKRFVRQSDVYMEFKNDLRPISEILSILKAYAETYSLIINPKLEQNREIRERLTAISVFKSTTVYPVLLNVIHAWRLKQLSSENLINILEKIEIFFLRRTLCGSSTNQLNKIFPSIIDLDLTDETYPGYYDTLTQELGKHLPNDQTLMDNIIKGSFYGNVRINLLSKYILTSIEKSGAHYKEVNFEYLTIEHIMPQTLDESWKRELGEDFATIHQEKLHSLGNLTLTGYNPNMSNNGFAIKKIEFAKSNLEINQYFSSIMRWDEIAIEQRTETLAKKIIEIWPTYSKMAQNTDDGITGTIPFLLTVNGKVFEVTTWRDVLKITFEQVYQLDTGAITRFAQTIPNLLNQNQQMLRAPLKTVGNYYLEGNLSAKNIYKLCKRLVGSTHLTPEDWKVESG